MEDRYQPAPSSPRVCWDPYFSTHFRKLRERSISCAPSIKKTFDKHEFMNSKSVGFCKAGTGPTKQLFGRVTQELRAAHAQRLYNRKKLSVEPTTGERVGVACMLDTAVHEPQQPAGGNNLSFAFVFQCSKTFKGTNIV
uniref:Uncharacterized protein n=1 Tax=Tetraselmis sp. GSL018 TaxID=582737 RepID=A0A061SC28_9CHLO